MAKSNFRIGEAVVDSIKLGANDTAIYLGAEKMYPLASYLTFDIKVGGNIKWSGSTTGNSLSYSKNGGTWTSVNSATTITVAAGDTISWKGTPTPQANKGIGRFSGNSAVRYDVKGNAMSLLYGDKCDGEVSLSEKNYAFQGLFIGNTNVVDASEMTLPATTLSNYCYNAMFSGCTSLTAAPELPATTLANYCYYNMFSGCASLTTAPVLLATTLANYCYYYMFKDCTGLTTAPSLPATTLTESCYGSMFNGCTSLTTAPVLSATTLVDYCYSYMFSGCTSLNYINALFTTTPTETYTSNWVSGVANSGTFIKSPNATWIVVGTNGVPFGWVAGGAELDITGTTQLTSASYITATNVSKISYSKKSTGQTVYISKNHINWTEMEVNTIYITNNSTIYMCGQLASNNDVTNYTNFAMIGNNISIAGNTNSIWNYSDVNADLKDYCGHYMFAYCSSLTAAPTLPATTLKRACYDSMFSGCTSLTTAPVLSATTLEDSCYYSMFADCTNLNTAPSLPATTMKMYCYSNMFKGCTSLTTAPVLSATTLAESCYRSMFQGCTSLTTAPELPATTLANSCYYGMFNGCTSLTTAPVLSATTLIDFCYSSMFGGCTSLTTAPSLPATTMQRYCYRSMFYGCTSLTTVPELPATILADNCYSSMFNGCTSLTTAPSLPATTLVSNCYNGMFSGCTSLSYIKALFTTEPTTAYTNGWVSGVASSGKFVKSSDATWSVTGVNGIPTDWTVEIEHAYVEIGGLKWATMNIGANSVTDYGLYFQWGDTQGYTFDQVTGSSTPHKDFGWADYKHGNGTSSPGVTGITKYNSSDGLTVLELVDDAARANWGGSWRMPTSGEMQSLIDSTTTAWTADYKGSGVSGVVFTDKTDSSKVLFFPAAGYCEYGSVNVGSSGSYWSSSLDSGRVQRARCLSFSSGGSSSVGYYGRYVGFSVRGVAD